MDRFTNTPADLRQCRLILKDILQYPGSRAGALINCIIEEIELRRAGKVSKSVLDLDQAKDEFVSQYPGRTSKREVFELLVRELDFMRRTERLNSL